MDALSQSRIDVDVFSSTRGPGTAWGAVDTVFALLSIAILVAACVGTMYARLDPGWSQILVLALLYSFVRAVLRHLLALKKV
jgi:hypothetical protein